jgi:hypothetical protein
VQRALGEQFHSLARDADREAHKATLMPPSMTSNCPVM